MLERDQVAASLEPIGRPAVSTPPERIPEFARSSEAIRTAFLVAREAHEGPGHGDTKLTHPVAVAELVSRCGFDVDVVSAAMLHDTVEDTRLGIAEIRGRFGVEIASLVADLTEDPRIAQYPARKADARGRAIVDPRAAAIYAADKLANVRRLLESGERIDGERLDHYVKTLRFLCDVRPELPFLAELSMEMTTLFDREFGADRADQITPFG
ncbi:MAG: HD domain-containing protein [Solirubrobacterales bacterium]